MTHGTSRIDGQHSPTPFEQTAHRVTTTARLPSPIAEQQRIERIVSGLRIGEPTVINGSVVTVIDVATADLLERDRAVSADAQPAA